MSYRRFQLDMAHPFAPNQASRNLHPAFIANYAFIANFLVFAAITFPILGRPENALAEQAVFLRFLRSVIYGFRPGDFAMRPI